MAVESTVADSSETTATPEPVDSEQQEQCRSARGDTEQASPDSSSLVEGEQQAAPPPSSRPSSAAAHPASVIRSVKQEQELQQRPPRIEVIVGPRVFQPEFRPAQQVGSKRNISSAAGTNTPVVSSSTSPDPCFSRNMSPIPPNVMGPPPPPPPPQPAHHHHHLPPGLIAIAAPPQQPTGAGRSPAGPKAGQHQRIRKSTAGRRQHQVALDQEEPSSSIPEIEFDGTTVLCRVCGDKASGFHYGVHSCEGCKGFFRRSIQQKIQYRPCTKNQQCSILRINRNRCQYCRLKKCVAVGMSRDAVRFGRVPKREKAKILAAMQSVNARLAEQRTLPAEFSDDVQLMQAVVRAHMETCEFTRDKVQVLMAKAHQQPNYTACPPTLACPLNPTPAPSNGQQQLLQDFSERFLPAIRDVVEFAKRLPGFSLLAEDDKVTLLKPGVFEVLLVRLAAMFDSASNTMLCLNGQLLRRDALHNSSNARFLMDSMFEFAERLNSLQLNDAELGLFCAVVVVAADRPGLRNVELVERMQSKLRSVLDSMLSQAHPDKAGLFLELLRKIPDLRTLNTLHSEKLLAFKMTEQQQQQQQAGSSPSWLHQQHHSSDSYDEEGAKSPMGSVSSSGESACSAGEVMVMSDLPLLAAVAGSAAPLTHHHLHHHHRLHSRRRPRGTSHSENGSSSMSSDGEETDSGSTGGGDRMLRIVESPASSVQSGSGSSGISSHHHLHQSGMTMMAAGCPYGKMRKLDSPDDSGIESGADRYEKLSTASRSTNTSLCSSPRSSLEDKVKEVEDMHHHHPGSSATHAGSAPLTSSPNGRAPSSSSSVDDMPVLKRVLQAPPLFDTNSLMDEAYKPHKKFRALTLQQRKGESDVPSRVPVTASAPVSPPRSSPTSVLSAALSSPPATSSSYSALCNALTSGSSTLTSTHSTLARSLMEGPKLLGPINVEQQRRADLIVANIMRGTMSSPSPPPVQQQRTVLTQGPLYVASSSSPSYYQDERGTSTPPPAVASSSAESQPLNLSLKSPSSSPARPTTPVAPAHYFPQIHA